MKRLTWTLLALFSLASVRSEEAQDPGFIHLANSAVDYRFSPDNPDVGRATLAGDPSKPGIYVIRLWLKPGVAVPPHYHDQDRHVTVISGTWAFGTGDSGDCSAATPMPAGSYVFHPKGAVHFDGSCLGGEVVVQIIGEGPVKTIWVDTDE